MQSPSNAPKRRMREEEASPRQAPGSLTHNDPRQRGQASRGHGLPDLDQSAPVSGLVEPSDAIDVVLHNYKTALRDKARAAAQHDPESDTAGWLQRELMPMLFQGRNLHNVRFYARERLFEIEPVAPPTGGYKVHDRLNHVHETILPGVLIPWQESILGLDLCLAEDGTTLVVGSYDPVVDVSGPRILTFRAGDFYDGGLRLNSHTPAPQRISPWTGVHAFPYLDAGSYDPFRFLPRATPDPAPATTATKAVMQTQPATTSERKRKEPPGGDRVATPPVEEKAEDDDCKICFDAKRDTLATPCGHLCVCRECSDILIENAKQKRQRYVLCPVCRGSVKNFYPVYKV